MGIFNVFIVSKSGGLIYHYDHDLPQYQVEKTFGYPLDLKLRSEQGRVAVAFGQRDGICVGHILLAVNGAEVAGGGEVGGRDVFQVLEDKASYPLNLKFGRPKVTTNEKIVLASMFYPLYALAVQLSPETGSSGIQVRISLYYYKTKPRNTLSLHKTGVGDRHLSPVLLANHHWGQVLGGGRP